MRSEQISKHGSLAGDDSMHIGYVPPDWIAKPEPVKPPNRAELLPEIKSDRHIIPACIVPGYTIPDHWVPDHWVPEQKIKEHKRRGKVIAAHMRTAHFVKGHLVPSCTVPEHVIPERIVRNRGAAQALDPRYVIPEMEDIMEASGRKPSVETQAASDLKHILDW